MGVRLERRRFVTAASALVGSLLGAGSVHAAPSWEKIDEDEGIKVYSKDIPDSSIVAFRGEALIQQPIEKVLWVLADNEHRTEWVDRLKKSVILERKGPFDYVVYQHFSAPFPASDRDYVYRGQARRDAEGVVRISLESVEHPKAPTTVGVRGRIIKSRYLLTPKGDSTFVVVEIQMDPMGAIPTFIVNLVQKSWPMKTLKNLRTQVKKPYVGHVELPPAGG
ncbi:MAG TPA: START domain-containing protein [Polyangiaceae bacterium]|nr:START domain-containing protein [Polyangiaceae bacterium]